MFEVIYKYLLIVFLIVVLILLSYTGYIFVFDELDSTTIFIHKISGLILIIISFLHIYIKRKKLKKLTKEFIYVFTGKKVSLDKDMDSLLFSLETKNLEQLATVFNLNLEELNNIFNSHNIFYTSNKQTLKELSKINSLKPFFIIVKIVEYKSLKV